MCDEEMVVNKLDRPPLKNSEKIHGTENFQTNMGELQYLTEADEQTLREKLMGQENYTDDPRLSNFSNYYIVLSLFILFSMAFAAAGFGVYFNYKREARDNAWIAFEAWVFLEMIIAIPFAIYLKYRGSYKKAVKNGDLKVYRFSVEQKVIHEFYDDFHTFHYYIVIGNAYVKIGKKLYDRLHIGDPVRTAISSCRGSSYFALINDWGNMY
ncbi:MAG: hypothetical protein ACI4JB_11490 [Porcipelethomonas sp.]